MHTCMIVIPVAANLGHCLYVLSTVQNTLHVFFSPYNHQNAPPTYLVLSHLNNVTTQFDICRDRDREGQVTRPWGQLLSGWVRLQMGILIPLQNLRSSALGQWFSKRDPPAAAVSSSVRNSGSRTPTTDFLIQNLWGLGPEVCFHQPSRRFWWFSQTFENHKLLNDLFLPGNSIRVESRFLL